MKPDDAPSPPLSKRVPSYLIDESFLLPEWEPSDLLRRALLEGGVIDDPQQQYAVITKYLGNEKWGDIFTLLCMNPIAPENHDLVLGKFADIIGRGLPDDHVLAGMMYFQELSLTPSSARKELGITLAEPIRKAMIRHGPIQGVENHPLLPGQQEQFILGMRYLIAAGQLHFRKTLAEYYIETRTHPLLESLDKEYVALWEPDASPFFGLTEQLWMLTHKKLNLSDEEEALKNGLVKAIYALPGATAWLEAKGLKPSDAAIDRQRGSSRQDQNEPHYFPLEEFSILTLTCMNMHFPDRFSYDFFPVGQGLFTTGSLRKKGEVAPRFLWVYDCGTSSSPKLIDRGINVLDRWAGTRKRIDLLTLSHFDHDHISGVCQLLKRFKIGTLMLPYMPLVQRLVVAFEEGSGDMDDPETDFYLNPVAYLRAQDGPGIEQILFVSPRGDQGPPFPGEAPPPQEPGAEDGPILDFRSDNPEFSEDIGPLLEAAQRDGEQTHVKFLRRGSPVTVRSCRWEFVPYNDDPETPITDDFIRVVKNEMTGLLGNTNAANRASSLMRLRSAYDRHFGSDSESRNKVSLFLYSGPIYQSWSKHFVWLSYGHNLRGYPPMQQAKNHGDWIDHHNDPRCSIIYTGDGYLDTPERLNRLTDYLRSERIERTGLLQVMHHGAEGNWHHGVGAVIDPLFSVFSSDPERVRLRHPHAQVLRDFWGHGPVQVDKTFGFQAFGYLADQFTRKELHRVRIHHQTTYVAMLLTRLRNYCTALPGFNPYLLDEITESLDKIHLMIPQISAREARGAQPQVQRRAKQIIEEEGEMW
jgi:beta-lactamase superfamily II metal-dependent hydrolase